MLDDMLNHFVQRHIFGVISHFHDQLHEAADRCGGATFQPIGGQNFCARMPQRNICISCYGADLAERFFTNPAWWLIDDSFERHVIIR